jgi:NAD(P)H dehydrogenase (quinone)
VIRTPILVLYYSRNGSTAELARHVARGVESAGADAVVRTVPRVAADFDAQAAEVPAEGPPYATIDELRECAGLVIGSPTRFGNMAAPLKYFLEQTSDLWLSGSLVDKPAGVFTSSSSAHGGQESTLLTMALPLVHHGMLWVGVPYTSQTLFSTRTGGGPYGASHVDSDWNPELSADEARVAHELGRRVADIALRLARD